MSEQRCLRVRELAPEVALGVAPVEERALVLAHAAECAGCRAHLMELSGVADDLLLLAPPGEPPSGFESSVLARLSETEDRHRRPGRFRRILGLAAAVVLVATLSAGAVWWADRPDRQLADQVRQTLVRTDGDYFEGYALRAPGGEQRGSVFAYQGDPAWLLCALDEPLPPGSYQVELVTADGSSHVLASGRYLAGRRAWGYEMPGQVHDAAVLRVLDGDGRLLLSTRFAH